MLTTDPESRRDLGRGRLLLDDRQPRHTPLLQAQHAAALPDQDEPVQVPARVSIEYTTQVDFERPQPVA